MEQYYIPLSVTQPSDITKFGIEWIGDNYRIFNDCPESGIGGTLSYVECNRYGNITRVGSTQISTSTSYIVGTGCSLSAYQISTASASNSLLDVPSIAPFAPIYFILSFFLVLFVFLRAWRMIFGHKLGGL